MGTLVVHLQHVPVSLGAQLEIKFPHFVDQNYFCESGLTQLVFIQMVTPCGMDRGAVPLAPVAPSTHHRGSM